jgi:hypothetical protein
MARNWKTAAKAAKAKTNPGFLLTAFPLRLVLFSE